MTLPPSGRDRRVRVRRNWPPFTASDCPRAPRNLEVVLSTGARFQPDTILFAAGRVPITEGLDMHAAAVKIDSLCRILVDEHFRASADSVFAAGDVLRPIHRIHSDGHSPWRDP